MLLLKLMLISVELLIGGKGDTLNLNLQSLILFVYLLNVMLMSILLYL